MAEEEQFFELITIPDPPFISEKDEDDSIDLNPRGTPQIFAVAEDGSTAEIYSYGSFKDSYFEGLTTVGDLFIEDTDTGKWYVFNNSEGKYVEFTLGNPYSISTSNPSILLESFVNQTLLLLSSTALEYGYDSIDNAISYYNSSVTAWAGEAAAFNIWRDNTLSLMYENINGFTADGITLPDLDGFTGQTGYQPLALEIPSRPQLFS